MSLFYQLAGCLNEWLVGRLILCLKVMQWAFIWLVRILLTGPVSAQIIYLILCQGYSERYWRQSVTILQHNKFFNVLRWVNLAISKYNVHFHCKWRNPSLQQYKKPRIINTLIFKCYCLKIRYDLLFEMMLFPELVREDFYFRSQWIQQVLGPHWPYPPRMVPTLPGCTTTLDS